MKTNLTKQLEMNASLLSRQGILRTKYDDAIKANQEVQQRQKDLKVEIAQLHNSILAVCPGKQLPAIESIVKPVPSPSTVKTTIGSPSVPTLSSTPPPQLITSRTMSVPTAAARKMGVGFPLNTLRSDDTGRVLSTQCASNDELLNECGICKKCTDQHLLAKCDTCGLYYHLGCLNPPLTRHPKRSKTYAWQCSECDSDESAPENAIIPKGPRRSRIRYSKDGPIFDLRDSFGSDKSLSLSKKSDESHHRTLNGSEVELVPAGNTSPPAPQVNEPFFSQTVPTTSSTPIAESIIILDSTEFSTSPTIKKRGRKPKPKPTIPAFDSPLPIDLSTASSELSSAPSKDTSTENNLDSFIQTPLIVSKTEMIAPSIIFVEKNSFGAFPEKTITKKGRPSKEKPSITQISNKLQKQQAVKMTEEKPEVTLVNLKQNTECPLQQFQSFGDINTIPYATSGLEDAKNEDEIIPVFPITKHEPLQTNGVTVNGEGTTSSSSGHHKHKKHKKDKKRKHSNSPSSGEHQTISKKHKNKRKKDKTHDAEEAPISLLDSDRSPEPLSYSLNADRSPEQPRIKIKLFKAGKDEQWSLPTAGDIVKDNSSYMENSITSEQVRTSKNYQKAC